MHLWLGFFFINILSENLKKTKKKLKYLLNNSCIV